MNSYSSPASRAQSLDWKKGQELAQNPAARIAAAELAISTVGSSVFEGGARAIGRLRGKNPLDGTETIEHRVFKPRDPAAPATAPSAPREIPADVLDYPTLAPRKVPGGAGSADSPSGATPNAASVASDAGAPVTASARLPARTQAEPLHSSANTRPPSATVRTSAPSLTAGPAFKVGDIEPSSGRQILHPDADINPILDRVTAASPPFRAALDEVTAAVPGAHVFGVRVETNVERILEKIAGSAPRTRRQGPISLR